MKNIQDNVLTFCQEHDMQADPTTPLLDLTSELGEVAKEILTITSYGKQPTVKKQKISRLNSVTLSIHSSA